LETVVGGSWRDVPAWTVAHCGGGPFLVQELQILEKLVRWSIWIFVSKLTIFSGKKVKMFEFLRLNWPKIVILVLLFGQF